MATEQKDFKVKNGIVVGGNIASTTGGFLYNSTSNTLTLGGSAVALQSSVDTVQNNVLSQTSNLYNTYTGLTANTYNTYNTLTANDYNTYTALAGLINTVQDNVTAAGGDVGANLYNTYVTLSGRINTVQDNVASNSGKINTVQSNLSSLSTDVGTNTNNINTVQSNLTSLASTVSTNTGNINTVQSNLSSLAGVVSTNTSNINTVQSNVTANAARLDSLKYFRRITANGVNIDASANADTLTISAGDGITLLGDDSTKTLTIHVDGASDVNRVQDNVTALTANVNTVQDNVAAILDGSSPFTGAVTFQQNVTIDGDLIVGGSQTTIGSVDTTIQDRTIILSNGATSASFDTGLLLSRGSDSNVFIGFDESADQVVAAYTQDQGGNTVTDFTFSSYANFHANNLVVEGTVDGVDVAAANVALQAIETALPTISGNTVTNANRLNSLKYYNTIQVAGQTDVAASSNADVLTLVGGTGITLTTAADQITIAASVGGDIDRVQDNVTALTANVNTVSSNVNTVQSNVTAVTDGTTPFTGAVTFNSTIAATVAKLNTQLHVTSNVKSSIGSADTEIFNFPGATYRGAELTVLTQDISNSEYQICKMLIVHDGTTVHFTEYGIVHTGSGELSTFNVTIDGSDVISVRASGGSANKKISVASHNLIQ
jgi:archaellum component FlaC